MEKDKELKVVYSGSLIDANCLKGLLEEKSIKVFLQDEIMGVVAPWAILAGGVKVMVAGQDFNKAQAVVQDFLHEGFGDQG